MDLIIYLDDFMLLDILDIISFVYKIEVMNINVR